MTSSSTIARIPGSGAIAARGTITGFDVGLADRTDDTAIYDFLPDGTGIYRFTLVATDLPDGFRIKLRTHHQGATFANGSRDFEITAADFDENGITTIEILYPPGSDPRVCHTAQIVTDLDTAVDVWGPFLYNLPPKNRVEIRASSSMVVNDNHGTRSDVWDKDIDPVTKDFDLTEVTLRAINIRNEPVRADFNLNNLPEKISPRFWADDEKKIEFQILWSNTVQPGKPWEQKFFVEGVKNSEDIDLDLVEWSGTIEYGAPDEKTTRVYQVDLDVDSDNNGTIDGDDEDRIERSFDPDHPGKVVIAEIGKDTDSDGVPDFADGLGLPPLIGQGTSGSWGDERGVLVPMTVELKEPIDLASATVIFYYGDSVSIPRLKDDGGGHIEKIEASAGGAARSYHLTKTGLRIWAVDAPDRDGTAQAANDVTEDGGKFIPSDTEIPWAKLAEANGQSPNQRVLTLYLEYATALPLGGSAQQIVAGKKPIHLSAIDQSLATCSDALFAFLASVDLYTDMDNDGALTSADSRLTSKPYAVGANDQEKDKGTEFLLTNDTLSNGAWDKEDIETPGRPSAVLVDDDAEKLFIDIKNLTAGEVWFDHAGISGLSFYRSPICLPEHKVHISPDQHFDLGNGSTLPQILYVRADGDIPFPSDDPQVVSDLVLMLKLSGSVEAIEAAKVRLTLVKQLGAKKYFLATKDYIYEQNAKFCARSWIEGQHNYRVISMLESKTTMHAYDAYPSKETGIDEVVASQSNQTVIINGNQCFDLHFDALDFPTGFTTKCHGRIVSAGSVLAPPSDDRIDGPGSPLAGAQGGFLGQKADGTFLFRGGMVPNAEYRSAMGGLSTFYEDRRTVRSQIVGRVEAVADENLVFTATQIEGGGGVPDLRDAAVASGVASALLGEDPSLGARGAELLCLDGQSSVAVAYENGSGTLVVGPNPGRKHSTGYFINTYLMFQCTKPR